MIYYPIYAGFVQVASLMLTLSSCPRLTKRILFFIFIFFASIAVSFLDLSDFRLYEYRYNLINPGASFRNQSLPIYGEPIYEYLAYLFKSFNISFQNFRIFLVFIPLVLKLYFLETISPYFLVSFLIYLAFSFYADSYLLRSTFAASLICCGILSLIKTKRRIWFFIFIFCAAGFHVSALTALPLIMFRDVRFSKNTYLAIIFILIFIGQIGLGTILIDIVANLGSSDVRALARIAGYKHSIYAEAAGLLRLSTLFYLFLSIIFAWNIKHIRKMYPKADLVLIVALYSLVFLVAFNDVEVFSDRLFRLYVIFFSAVFGFILKLLSSKDKIYILGFSIIIVNMLALLISEAPFRTI